MEQTFHPVRHNWKEVFARYNVAPAASVPVLYATEEGLVGDTARWGLVPAWWRRPTLPALTFNARSEEAAEKPAWRESLRAARCLMPALGWYEWNEQEPVRTRAGRRGNQPYYFQAQTPGVVAIAGLRARWQAPDGSVLLSCALLSRAAAGPAAAIHDRMPVVLDAQDQAAWLAPDAGAAQIARLIAGARRDFTAHRVDTRVNSTRVSDAALIDPVAPAGGDLFASPSGPERDD